jgi:arsenite methyltransferase
MITNRGAVAPARAQPTDGVDLLRPSGRSSGRRGHLIAMQRVPGASPLGPSGSAIMGGHPTAPSRWEAGMSMLRFDDEAARRIERVYSTPDVVQQRADVLALLAVQPGERVLDVGSGPGFLVASLADAVGPSGAVRGLDPSAPMNTVARDVTAGRSWVGIDDGDALALPYPDGMFDAAAATQVYEYVADIPAALAELRRVLRPGGRALVLDTDWDSVVWHAADRDRHRRVMAAWEEHLVHLHLPCTLPGLLRRAGFRVARRSLIPLFNAVYEQDTFSAHIMELIARFVVGRQGLTGADVDAWTADLRERGAEDDYLFSINRYCFLAVASQPA